MNIVTVPLLPDGEAIIDKSDEALVSGFVWRRQKGSRDNYTDYARAQHRNLYVFMHRLVAGAGPNDVVDHINGDGLDNRLVNLRLCTRSQNLANSNQLKRGTSQYRGVYWDKSKKRWMARIHLMGRGVYLGRFLTEEDAAKAYDTAAFSQWGEFARLNFTE